MQRKPRKEKQLKEKHEYGPVNPKGQENRDNIREVGEILGDMQPRATRGPQEGRNPDGDVIKGISKQGEDNRRRREHDVDNLISLTSHPQEDANAAGTVTIAR